MIKREDGCLMLVRALAPQTSSEELAEAWVTMAKVIDGRRPVMMDDQLRLLNEALWAIGKYRFGNEMVKAVNRTDYTQPSGPEQPGDSYEIGAV